MADPKSAKGGAKGAGTGAKDSAKVAKTSPAEAKASRGAPSYKTASAEDLQVPKDYLPRLRKHYDEVVRQKMIEEFGYKNPFEVPVIEKIVLNMGVGEAVNDTKKVTLAAADLALIAGQKPVITKARNAISRLAVPLATVMQCFTPACLARTCSNSAISGPMINCPWLRTRRILSSISAW